MKRLFGIRHVRWFFLSTLLLMHLRRCQEMDVGLIAHDSDLKFLDDVWNGTR